MPSDIFNILIHTKPLLLSHGSKHSHLVEENHAHAETPSEEHINIRAALIHVLGDLIQSIG